MTDWKREHDAELGLRKEWSARAQKAEAAVAALHAASKNGEGQMTEVELRKLKSALSDRLNNVLCEMKPDYDDSITGFNEAWDVMGKFFDDKIQQLIAASAHD